MSAKLRPISFGLGGIRVRPAARVVEFVRFPPREVVCMNRLVDANAAALPNTLFWLERGYPSTLIFDPYEADADRTQQRRVAEGTQEVRAVDVLEEQLVPDTMRSPVLARVDATQEIEPVDVLEVSSVAAPAEVEPVSHAVGFAPPPAPPPRSEAQVAAIFTPARQEHAPPTHEPPTHEPPTHEPMVIVALAEAPLARDSEPRREVAPLSTAEWQRRRRTGHWLAGAALLAASGVILLASALHAFAGEPGEALRSARSEADVRTGRTTLLLVAPPAASPARAGAVTAPQAAIPTVSFDALPVARRGRR
jgi:hypothetical protein